MEAAASEGCEAVYVKSLAVESARNEETQEMQGNEEQQPQQKQEEEGQRAGQVPDDDSTAGEITTHSDSEMEEHQSLVSLPCSPNHLIVIHTTHDLVVTLCSHEFEEFLDLGDVITAVNGRPVKNRTELKTELRKAAQANFKKEYSVNVMRKRIVKSTILPENSALIPPCTDRIADMEYHAGNIVLFPNGSLGISLKAVDGKLYVTNVDNGWKSLSRRIFTVGDAILAVGNGSGRVQGVTTAADVKNLIMTFLSTQKYAQVVFERARTQITSCLVRDRMAHDRKPELNPKMADDINELCAAELRRMSEKRLPPEPILKEDVKVATKPRIDFLDCSIEHRINVDSYINPLYLRPAAKSTDSLPTGQGEKSSALPSAHPPQARTAQPPVPAEAEVKNKEKEKEKEKTAEGDASKPREKKITSSKHGQEKKGRGTKKPSREGPRRISPVMEHLPAPIATSAAPLPSPSFSATPPPPLAALPELSETTRLLALTEVASKDFIPAEAAKSAIVSPSVDCAAALPGEDNEEPKFGVNRAPAPPPATSPSTRAVRLPPRCAITPVFPTKEERSLLGKDPELASPAQLARIGEFVHKLKQTGVHGLYKEFTQLKNYNVSFHKHACPFVADKNRYLDIPCLLRTRVVLRGGKKDDDYIHANFISGTRFICTQGPMVSTFAEFWRMCEQENVGHIIMLCDFIELGKAKCDKYYSDTEGGVTDGGKVLIRTTTIDASDVDFITSVLEVTRKCDPGKKKLIYHYKWKEWPDRGVPESTMAALRILKQVRGSKMGTVVHCSAGVGRTGTLVAIEITLQALLAGTFKGMGEELKQLRHQRAMAIQTPAQFAYVAQAVYRLFTLLDKKEDIERDYVLFSKDMEKVAKAKK